MVLKHWLQWSAKAKKKFDSICFQFVACTAVVNEKLLTNAQLFQLRTTIPIFMFEKKFSNSLEFPGRKNVKRKSFVTVVTADE